MIKIYTAPIAGVTDYTYRGILKEFKPDLLFTEMVSINALEVACEKTLKVILRLREGDSVQLFGKDIKKNGRECKICGESWSETYRYKLRLSNEKNS